ncbi:MAG: hypothetical protein NC118_04375 [Eubacterium sp.]|nr:hypothetical protein [Eubacterium sp.]
MILQVLHCAKKNVQEHLFGDVELQSPNFIASIKERVKEAYDSDEEIESVSADLCSGYIGIKTDMDTYIHVYNGKEIYLRSEDSQKKNRVNEIEYLDRIELLRSKITDIGESL